MAEEYSPTLGSRLLGGLQWVLTALVIVGTITDIYFKYLMRTRSGSINISYGREVTIVLAIAFIGGYLWVARRTEHAEQEIHEYGQRLDYLLVLWIGWPVVFGGLAWLFGLVGIQLWTGYLFYIGYSLGSILCAVVSVYCLQLELAARFVG